MAGQDNGNEAPDRATRDAFVEGRLQSIARLCAGLARGILELGPCYAVTVAFTGAGAKEGQAVTETFSLWFNSEMGAGHLAEVSDRLNQQHVELQAKLDQEQEMARDAEGTIRAPEGGDDRPDRAPGGSAAEGEEG